MSLIVDRKGAFIEFPAVRRDHPAVTRRYCFENIKTVDPEISKMPDILPLIFHPERLGAVLYERNTIRPRDLFNLINTAGVS